MIVVCPPPSNARKNTQDAHQYDHLFVALEQRLSKRLDPDAFKKRFAAKESFGYNKSDHLQARKQERQSVGEKKNPLKSIHPLYQREAYLNRTVQLAALLRNRSVVFRTVELMHIR